MTFDFDQTPERRGSDSIKWGKYAGRDIIPMWVADADFTAPPAVLEALHARISHGVFGYGDAPPSLVSGVVEAMARDHGWRIEPQWLIWLPGLVSGLNIVCRAVGDPGDAVVTATPIYPLFLSAPRFSEREVITVDLVEGGDCWQWDFDRLEAAITAHTRLLMLCNPHNPVGRVFDREELARLADIAARHELVICSDEIHCDLVLDQRTRHLPIAALDESVAQRTITLMAPSKTWNIPGLGCAFAVVPNAHLRRRLHEAMRGIVPHVNVLGYAATEAAYRHGVAWRSELLAYLRGNAGRAFEAISAMRGLHTWRPQATYLAWIDARGLGVDNPHRFFEQAGVGLSEGAEFGAPGFVRLNFGCSRSTLDQGLDRMARAVAALR